MKKYRCTICGYIYDEAVEKVKFADLPEDWQCPLCGAPKSLFEEVIEQSDTNKENKENSIDEGVNKEKTEDLKELAPEEIAYICSNLARGAEKEYLFEEQQLFMELFKYYESRINSISGTIDDVANLIAEDNNLFNEAFAISDKYNDRGSKRVLTWASKTTNIVKSILEKYKNDGLESLKNTKIWVCDICGFVYIGDTPPAICPICKVPSLKILEVK